MPATLRLTSRWPQIANNETFLLSHKPISSPETTGYTSYRARYTGQDFAKVAAAFGDLHL
jgi:hypothetical protein